MSLSYLPPHKRQAEGQRLGKLSARAWTPQEADADTLRMRALSDSKGAILRHGVHYTSNKETRWAIARSATGRANQLDVIFDGKLSRTCGPRSLPPELRPSPNEHRLSGEPVHLSGC
jgi:hypothetical protein